MSDKNLEDRKPLKRNDSASPTASFIFMHGLGDDADGWTNIADQFRGANKLPHLNWIFPTAPYSHDAGTTAWYKPSNFSPITVGRSTNPASNAPSATDEEGDEDQAGVLKSVDYLCDLIDAEVKAGISLHRIVIGGFSQGCFVSLAAGLGGRYKGKIAGVIGLSGGMNRGSLIKKSFEGFTHDVKGKEMRVFIAHGTRDMLVPMRVYRDTLERVEGVVGKENVEGHTYEGMGHVTCGKEFLDMLTFLEGIIPEQV